MLLISRATKGVFEAWNFDSHERKECLMLLISRATKGVFEAWNFDIHKRCV